MRTSKLPRLFTRRRFRHHQLRIEQLECRRVLASLPAGFTLDSVVTNLSGGVAFDFAPDGRIFIAEKSGTIQVADNGVLTEFVNINSLVNSNHDRGMLGIAVHPSFPQEPYVYVSYTHDPAGVTPDAGHSRVARVTRFTADANANYAQAVAGSETILVGMNSTLAHIPEPNVRNPANPACGNIGAYVQDCIPSDEISHTIGAVRFGDDGWLYVASGDGGRFTGVQDYNVRAVDPNSLAGKILRVHPGTGLAHPDNPFHDGDPNSNRSKVYSMGLRNPFRFELDPVTGEPFIGDVGWNAWEEVNYGSANFGWPCYEGGNGVLVQQGGYSGFSQCTALYAAGTATPAIYAYPHTSGSSSVQVGDVYEGIVYPAQYQDALFFFDFNIQEMSTITLNAQREAQSVDLFGSDLGGIVQVSRGPDTNLYLLDIFAGELQRLRYTAGGNTPPTAAASASQVDAFTYDFSSQGSYDPDADPLDYLWDFGDGNTSTLPHPTHTFTTAGPVSVTLTVSDPSLANDSDTVDLFISNLLPTAEISLPANGSNYQVGDTILLNGSGMDPEDGVLTGASLLWNVKILHNAHSHLDFHTENGETGSFLATDHDDNSHFEICLTATDSLGGQDTACTEIFPDEVDYTFTSDPTGLLLNYSGVDAVTPFTVTAPVNSVRSISAPAAQSNLIFDSWSDNGAASHNITIGQSSETLTATYLPGSTVVTVRASGDTGDEIIALQIDQNTVATFALGTSAADYTHSLAGPITPDQVRVVFTNDQRIPPDYDRGVVVDYIDIDGQIFQTEHPSVLSTGTWDGSCDPGFKASERLDCGGYFQYDQVLSGGSEIVVRALGETGEEIVQLKIDGSVVATHSLTSSMQDYTYTHSTAVTPGQVRVEFINDLYAPPTDRNVVVDHIRIDDVVHETEAPTVLSTGTWDGTSCGAGFKASERLDCGGYFQYSDTIPGGSVVNIRALGVTGEEIIALQINQATVASFSLTSTMTDYGYTHTDPVAPGEVRVVFTNDLYAPPLDRTVVVDHITIDGVTYETEAPSVLSTGTWDGTCNAGFKQSETLHCGGYFEYSQPAPAPVFDETIQVLFQNEPTSAELVQRPVVASDFDTDGDVDFQDFLTLAENFGKDVLPGSAGDVDGDGLVRFADFLLFSVDFGWVTEPDDRTDGDRQLLATDEIFGAEVL